MCGGCTGNMRVNVRECAWMCAPEGETFFWDQKRLDHDCCTSKVITFCFKSRMEAPLTVLSR